MKKKEDMVFRLNIKSIMLFEQLTGKSFYYMGDEDLEKLIFAVLAVNNPELRLTEEKVDFILSHNVKMAKTLFNDLKEELQYIDGLQTKELKESQANAENGEEKEDDVTKISDVASMFIIQYGMDPKYVLYDMGLWEIVPYSRAIDMDKKEELTEKRFWTYLQMLPHIDGKKIGGPEKLIPFPWEKEGKKGKMRKDDAVRFMSENKDRITDFFKKQNSKDDNKQ